MNWRNDVANVAKAMQDVTDNVAWEVTDLLDRYNKTAFEMQGQEFKYHAVYASIRQGIERLDAERLVSKGMSILVHVVCVDHMSDFASKALSELLRGALETSGASKFDSDSLGVTFEIRV